MVRYDFGWFYNNVITLEFIICMQILLNTDYVSVWQPLFCMTTFRPVWNKAIALCNISRVTSDDDGYLLLKLFDRFCSSTHLYSWVEITRWFWKHVFWKQLLFAKLSLFGYFWNCSTDSIQLLLLFNSLIV